MACGTGLSSLALADLIDKVLAFDASAAMLERAASHPRVTYALAPPRDAPAGRLPGRADGGLGQSLV